MAVKLPNGATVHIATALAAEKKVTVATNAAECVLTVTGHGFANGDLVLFKSGWGKLNERVFQIGDVKTDTFKLTGIDTSNADEFPAGSGIGAVQKITDWVQVSQIVEFSTSGGEQQYVDFGFLEDDFDSKFRPRNQLCQCRLRSLTILRCPATRRLQNAAIKAASGL